MQRRRAGGFPHSYGEVYFAIARLNLSLIFAGVMCELLG